jgi:phage gp46-like protein
MADIAVAYDPTLRRCDLVFSGRDFALETTPLSAMLISAGTDRRARADDALPDAFTELDIAGPSSLRGRRGWAGDAFDVAGRLIGSRLWLLSREKATEATRRRAEQIAAEAVAWLHDERGYKVEVAVRWVARAALGVRLRVGAYSAEVQQAVAG